MIREILFDDGTRRWVYIGRDGSRPDEVIDTNEYIVSHGTASALLDPGGLEVFPPVVAAVSRVVDPGDIEVLFGSHQDPDIISSLALWLGVCPNSSVYVPAIWASFVAHFSLGAPIVGVPDEGGALPLGSSNDLSFIPAHYVHSSANFCLYDPTAKILFSGDIGAALLPEGENAVTVDNFDLHIQYMEGFHRRWMPSNRAKNDWVSRVRALEIEMICPQHGAVFVGEDVVRFLDWLGDLEVGTAV